MKALCLTFVAGLMLSEPTLMAHQFSKTVEGVFENGHKYKLEIVESELEQPKYGDGGNWGRDDYVVDSEVRVFRLSVDGEPANQPAKSYEDISQITSVVVTNEDGAVIITITGGDAASAYTAQFYFEETRAGLSLVRRLVRSRILPKLTETTQYPEMFYR